MDVAPYDLGMPATNTKQPRKLIGPSTAKRSKYARARVKAGLTMRDLCDMGFGMATVSKADKGQLPKHPAIKAAYLKAIGLSEEVAS